MFPDDMQSYPARERIAPLADEANESSKDSQDYFNREYTTVIKEGFDVRIIEYFNEDIWSWR